MMIEMRMLMMDTTARTDKAVAGVLKNAAATIVKRGRNKMIGGGETTEAVEQMILIEM